MQKAIVKLVVLSVIHLPFIALAQDDDKLKALAMEKTILEAQTARDTAETAAIKAAADLAKAKANASDSDTTILQTKAARDQAETAALNAAKALADAKATASSQDSQSQKMQFDAEAALTSSKVTAQTAELAAIKNVFGAAPNVGSDGNVVITDSTTAMLLESKSGSLKATGVLAGKLCEALKQRNVSGAFIAPPDLEKKMLASSFMLREFNELSRTANNDTNKGLVGQTVILNDTT